MQLQRLKNHDLQGRKLCARRIGLEANWPALQGQSGTTGMNGSPALPRGVYILNSLPLNSSRFLYVSLLCYAKQLCQLFGSQEPPWQEEKTDLEGRGPSLFNEICQICDHGLLISMVEMILLQSTETGSLSFLASLTGVLLGNVTSLTLTIQVTLKRWKRWRKQDDANLVVTCGACRFGRKIACFFLYCLTSQMLAVDMEQSYSHFRH